MMDMGSMDGNCEPVISVVMPVYNAEKYIKASVDSILSQTFTDFEFIIIDDGSTDDSLKILQRYEKKDKRVHLISRQNKGLIKTLNQGVALSKGRYVARMDADDVNLPLRFEKQVAYLDEHINCVAVGAWSHLIDSEGDLIKPMGHWCSHAEIDGAHIKGIGGAIVHPSAMIRREQMLKVNAYSESYPNAEDLDLWLRLAEIGELANIPEYLFLYRQHLESIGYTKRLSQYESAKKAVVAACNRRGIDFVSVEKYSINAQKVEDVYIKWGWWALKGNNISTARKYAKKSVLSNPLQWQAWKLLVCSILGY